MGKARGVVVACVLSLGCAGPRLASEPLTVLCEAAKRDGASPTAADYVSFLLRGYDAATRTVTSPALDCTGTQVRWASPALSCTDSILARTTVAERPIAPEDVLTTSVGEGRTLLWIPTARFASGDAMGPVALLEVSGRRMQALAVGVLRAYPLRARLRLEVAGRTPVLVAEGESCSNADRASCVRSARVVPLREGRFAPEPLVDRDGQCQSPAWFDLARSEVRSADGRSERVELSATLVFSEAGLAVEEQVVVRGAGSKPGGAPPPVLHRAQSVRTVQWSGGRAVVSGPSLWSRLAGGR